MNLDFYVDFWNRGLDFKGRSSREEFWYTYIVNFVINLAFIFLAFIPFLSVCQGIYGLAVLIPTLAISVRRLHDSNHTCIPLVILITIQFILTSIFLFYFISLSIYILSFGQIGSYTQENANFNLFIIALSGLFMVVTTIIYIIFMCLPSTKGMNKYGIMREKINLNKKSQDTNNQQNFNNQSPYQNTNVTNETYNSEVNYEQMEENQQSYQNMNSDNPYFISFEKTYGQQIDNKH